MANRAVQFRIGCVHSGFLAYVLVDGIKVENCTFESRLKLNATQLSSVQAQQVRAVETLGRLESVWGSSRPKLTVEITKQNSTDFQVISKAVRLGDAWLDNDLQLRRALIMGVVKSELPRMLLSQFQLEVLSDFLMLGLFSEDNWKDSSGQVFSLLKDAKFTTVAPRFADYCQSPFRSLAHHKLCQVGAGPDSMDFENRIWGFRALLSAGLYRIYAKLPLAQKIEVLGKIRQGEFRFPVVSNPEAQSVAELARWFQKALHEHAEGLGLVSATGEDSSVEEQAFRSTLAELDVDAPVHWEVTFDLVNTPAWREIVDQLKRRSQFRKTERTLVFTPEGEVALPSGMSVSWASQDVQSQKHVLIACQWPQPSEALNIKARQLFARQTCNKLTEVFWD